MNDIVSKIFANLKKNSPKVLTGLSIASGVIACAAGFWAGWKSHETVAKEVAERKKKDGVLEVRKNGEETLPIPDIFKATWKYYIPPAVFLTLMTASAVSSNKVSSNRIAATTAAYSLAESAFKEYRDKAVEIVGKKKVQDIKDAVDKDRVEKNPVQIQKIIVTEAGNTLCYDPMTGRYFKSDIVAIKKAINELNRQLNIHDFVTLNDFYGEVGLPYVDIGDDLGWSSDNGQITDDFSTQLSSDGVPCLVIGFMNPPSYSI